MQLVRVALAIAVLAAYGAAVPASAQQKQTHKRPVVINDPSVYRPRPPPHDRTYVGPGPTVTPPMERLPKVAPLAQPPIR